MPKKKKTDPNLLVITCFRIWWNAQAHYAFQLALAAKELHKNLHVIGLAGSPLLKKCKEQQIATHGLRSLFFSFRFFFLLQTLKPNQIFSFTSWEHPVLWLQKWKNPKSFFWVKIKSSAQKTKQHFFNRRLYAKMDQLVAVSPNTQKELAVFSPQTPPILYFGSKGPQGKIRKTKSEIKKNWGWKAELPVFCLLGRTQELKGHLEALQAFRPLCQQAYLLFLVKNLTEYPLEIQKIKEYIQKHNLQEKVKILGPQENLKEILQVVDCGLIPSKESEEICRVLVEFFSLSIPVIAYPTGALSSLVEEGKNGFLCHHKNWKDLNEKLQQFLNLHQFSKQKNHPLEKIKQESKKNYDLHFRWEIFVSHWKPILNHTISK